MFLLWCIFKFPDSKARWANVELTGSTLGQRGANEVCCRVVFNHGPVELQTSLHLSVYVIIILNMGLIYK